jgi:hypothetical protein
MHEEAIPIPRGGVAAASRNGATWPARNRSLTVSARRPVAVKPC